MTVEELLVKIDADITDVKNKFDELQKHSAKTTDGISSQFKQVASEIGAAFGLGAIVKFAKESVEAFAKTEESARVLDNTLKNIGVSDLQIKRVEQFVDKLEAATHFDDSEIRTALTNLVIKFGDADTAMKILTVSMQAARAKGEDLQTAVQKISLGLLGATRGLRDYGIEVKEGTTRMQVLDEIAKKTAGSIETFGETTAGSAEQMKVAFGNLKETIGRQLAPAINGLLQGLSKQIALMVGAGETSKQYQSAMTTLGRTIGSIFGGLLNTIANTITLAISGISMLIKTLVGLVTWNFGMVKDEFGTFKETLKNYVDIWKGVAATITGKNKETENNFKSVMSSIESTFKNTTRILNEGIRDTADNASNAADKTAKKAQETAKKVSDTVAETQEKIHERMERYTSLREDLLSRLTEFVKHQTELERDAKLKAIQDEIDARYNQYLQEIRLIDETANAQIAALQQTLDQMARDREEQRRREWLDEKNAALAAAKTDEERAKIQQEIQKQLAEWQYEDTVENIRKQIDEIRANAEKQKEIALQQYNEEKKLLEEKLEVTKQYYDELLLQRRAELEAEKILVSNSMDEILRMLEDKKAEWAALGTKIGDAFWSNLMGAINDVSDLLGMFAPPVRTPPVGAPRGFATGGVFEVSRPTLFIAGEAGRERVSITPSERQNDERVLKEMLAELRKFNNETAPLLGRQIMLAISGLGGKV
jgi:hypothetical protein